jgi:CRISPR-associated protein Cas1
MSLLYITEHGGMVGFEGNRITIRTKEHLRSLPVETIDSITMMGASQLTTNCMEQCMKRGIPVSFMSKGEENLRFHYSFL